MRAAQRRVRFEACVPASCDLRQAAEVLREYVPESAVGACSAKSVKMCIIDTI